MVGEAMKFSVIATWVLLALGVVAFIWDMVIVLRTGSLLLLIAAGGLVISWTFCFLAFRHARWGKGAI